MFVHKATMQSMPSHGASAGMQGRLTCSGIGWTGCVCFNSDRRYDLISRGLMNRAHSQSVYCCRSMPQLELGVGTAARSMRSQDASPDSIRSSSHSFGDHDNVTRRLGVSRKMCLSFALMRVELTDMQSCILMRIVAALGPTAVLSCKIAFPSTVVPFVAHDSQ